MLNEEIKDKEVRVIDSDGSQLGIMSAKEANSIALSKNLDLVKIAPGAKPPVCKIMDYGKYKFDQIKKEKEMRKNQKTAVIKEVRLSPSIDDHDVNTKLNSAIKFLKAGDKVKVTVRFRGRELHHSALGLKVLENFGEAASEYGVIEKAPKLEGKNMFMFIAPKTKDN